MKKIIVMTIVAVLVLSAGSVLADYYGGRMNYARVTGYAGTTGGGEFTLYPVPGHPYLDNSAYSTLTKNIGGYANSFQTFCVEMYEYTEHPMDIWVSTTEVDETTGNLTGNPGSHAILGGKNGAGNWNLGDNLDPMTAYLYTHFAYGTLAGYIYTPGPGRVASATALQDAIWYIENEKGGPLTGQALAFYNAAKNAVDSGSWTGIGQVRVLNMYTVSGGVKLRQDMLWVPAPAAIILGLMGLSAVGLWMRRRA